MKLFCCHTPAHAGLFERHFTPSIPAGFALHSKLLEIDGAGDFLSPEFVRCISQKVDLILDSIGRNPGEIIVWSDVDVMFFDLDPTDLAGELADCDIAFQLEHRDVAEVNTGFFVCRCTDRVARFFTAVKEHLTAHPGVNEQRAANELLAKGDPEIAWKHLPPVYYARTQGWPPPRGMRLYHANATAGANGVQRKLAQFREVHFLRRFGLLALGVTSLKYAASKCWRRFRRLPSVGY